MVKVILITLLMTMAGCYDNPVVYEVEVPQIPEPPNTPLPPIKPPPRAGFVNVGLIEDTILLDLQTLDSANDRENARYLIACDLYNQDKDLTLIKQAIDLGMNRLSREVFLNPVTPIGNADCIYRIDLQDYTLTRREWRLIEINTVFDFVPNSIRAQNIQFLTQTRKPYVWAFELCTMFECDEVADKNGAVYYDLVDQDIRTDRFLLQEGIVLQEEVDNEDVVLAGFTQSQIALGKGRLILAVESNSGYCLATYDVAQGGDDIFTNPFTRELTLAGGRINSDKLLEHDAQEWICSLDNGLFGLWRLNNANDLAEVEAPTNIVLKVGARIDGAIRIGDCGECHYKQVAIPFVAGDQISNHIQRNSAFDEFEKNIGEIFFNYNKLSAVIEEVNRRNAFALRELGVDIDGRRDPLTGSLFDPYRNEMNSAQVAALVLMTETEFLQRLSGTEISSQVLGNLNDGGTVSLQVLSDNYNTLTLELRAFEDADL
jgi:hypothetical protein